MFARPMSLAPPERSSWSTSSSPSAVKRPAQPERAQQTTAPGETRGPVRVNHFETRRDLHPGTETGKIVTDLEKEAVDGREEEGAAL